MNSQQVDDRNGVWDHENGCDLTKKWQIEIEREREMWERLKSEKKRRIEKGDAWNMSICVIKIHLICAARHSHSPKPIYFNIFALHLNGCRHAIFFLFANLTHTYSLMARVNFSIISFWNYSQVHNTSNPSDPSVVWTIIPVCVFCLAIKARQIVF